MVAFDGEINDSIKWRKENSVTQQDLTSTIEEDDIHIIPHVSQRMKVNTAWKAFRYGVFSGPNTGKYGPEKTLYLDTFHAVKIKQYYHIIEWCWRRNFGFVLHGKICKRRVTKTLD